MSYQYKHNRRQFLQRLAVAGSASMLAGIGSNARAATYSGKLVVNMQLTGALDVTSFADPKVNVTGQKVINNWAASASPKQAGNILYAPFAANETFFNKYYRDILIINGVDAQTNSHTVGILHNWSGRNSEGYPTLTALFAAINNPGTMPMPYLNFGGFAATSGITEVTQVGQISVLQNLVKPNVAEASSGRYIEDADWARILAMHTAGLASRAAASTTLEAAATRQLAYADALTRSTAIADFAAFIPATLQATRTLSTGGRSTLHQQIQITLLAFKAGVAMTADVFEGGFDTHEENDTRQAASLSNVTDAIDYFWTYATELGLADRIVLVVGSDFGRTPYYNSGAGKDHWPIGSVMVMQKNASYTNRVRGLTDSAHNAVKINPTTFAADSTNGITLKPAHVQKALRKHLGLESSAVSALFPFSTTETVPFFG